MDFNSIYAFLENSRRDNHLVIRNTGDWNEIEFLSKMGIGALDIENPQISSHPHEIHISGTTGSLRAGVWDIEIRIGTAGAMPVWAGVLTLTGSPIYFSDFFGRLLPSRFIQNRVMLIRGDSILAKVRIESHSTMHINGDLEAADASFVLDFAETGFASEAAFLGVDHQTATGPVDIAYGIFDLEAPSPFSFENMFAPIPISVQRMGIRLISPILDVYSVDDNDNQVSAANLFANALLEGPGKECRLVCPLLHSELSYDFAVDFDGGLSITDGIQFIQSMFGVQSSEFLALPDIFNIVVLKSIEISVDSLEYSQGVLPHIGYIGILIGTADDWKPSIPFVQLQEISTYWGISFSTVTTGDDTDYYLSGQIGAKLSFGTDEKNPLAYLTGTIYVPSYNMEFRLTDQDQTLPLNSVMQQYLGSSGGIPSNLKAFDIRVEANLPLKTFYASMQINELWQFSIGKVDLSLSSIGADIAYTGSQLVGSVSGRFVLYEKSDMEAALSLAAEYKGTHWLFSGGLYYGTLNLPQLFFGLIGVAAPNWVQTITIELTKLWMSFSTEQGYPFTLEAAIDSGWNIEALGLAFNLGAAVKLERTADQENALRLIDADSADKMIYKVDLSGYFKISSFQVGVGAAISTAPNDPPLYRFRVAYNDLYLEAAMIHAGTGEKKHQALKINLGGISVGGLIEYFINYINPNMHYVLEAPWNILNQINLSGLDLIIDPTDKKLSAIYKLDLDLKFIKIDTLGLVWNYAKAEDALDIQITGGFLGMKYGEDDPVKWDALNESAPSTTGGSGLALKIYYLAMGQHVRGNTGDLKDITGIINKLKSEMQPVDDFSQSLPMLRALTFDENSNWIIAMDFELVTLFRLKVLFNDPYVYGLSVRVDDGAMKGLLLEILYKKITDDIGMFKGRFLLPEAFRSFEAGVFSITIGLIDIEIYTNGNFLIDLGFPHNKDFSNSFVIQVKVFLGEGGLYFGVLNSSTTNLVPAIENGAFDPVIAFGVGFKIGLGRKFTFGPLKVGAALQALAILEGVGALFLPNNTSQSKGFYFKVSGTVGIVGEIYADLDLCVVQVSLKLQAAALVSFEFEAYKAAVLAFAIQIAARGKLKVTFISVSFSFDVSLEFSFELGSASTPPWQLSQAAGGNLVARRRHSWRMLPGTQVNPAEISDALGKRLIRSSFRNGELLTIDLKILPLFSADGISLLESPGAQTDKIAFLLFVDNQEQLPDGRLLSAQTDDESETPFNQLLELIGSWMLSAVPGDAVTGAQLKALLSYLETDAPMDEIFTKENLDQLFQENAVFRISGAPSGMPESYAGVFFPAFPELDLIDCDGAARELSSYNMVSDAYLHYLLSYFSKLNPNGQDDNLTRGPRLGEEGESFATVLFREYFFLAAKAIAQHMDDLMASYPYSMDGSLSLREICGHFNREEQAAPYRVRLGDTVERIATAFDLSAWELRFLNPDIDGKLGAAAVGDVLEIHLGLTPQAIVLHNADLPLRTGAEYRIEDISCLAAEDDTLSGIAASFSSDAGAILSANRDGYILRYGSVFQLREYLYDNAPGLTEEQVAAVFYTRLNARENPYAEWYFDAINDLNQNNEGMEEAILYPAEYGVLDPENAQEWKTLPGDDTLALSRYLAWMANPDEEYSRFRSGVRLQQDGSVKIPEWTVTVPGQVPEKLEELLLCSTAQLSRLIGDAPVLAPLVTIAVPDAVMRVQKDETLASFAVACNLSVEELAVQLVDEKELLEPGMLSLPAMYCIGKEQMVAAVKEHRNRELQGEFSRFFLSGLQLPVSEGSQDMRAVFELSGQQFNVPPLGPDAPEEFRYGITKDADRAPWISFYESDVYGAHVRHAIGDLNRVMDRARPDKHGVVFLTGQAEAVEYAYTREDLAARLPVGPVKPEITIPLQESAVAASAPLRLDLSREIPWLDASVSLFEFACDGIPATGYRTNLMRVDGEATEALEGCKLAGLFPVKIRKRDGSCYEVLGADDAERNRLIELVETAQVRSAQILYATSPVDRKPTGFQGVSENPLPILIKTNLSRETRNLTRYGSKMEENASNYFSNTGDPKAFLTLLWQGSVVGGEGYWLQLSSALPDSLFNGEEQATIWVLATIEGNVAYPFTDYACIPADACAGPGEKYLSCDDELQVSSLVQTGFNGFRLQLSAPEENQEDSDGTDLNSLFSILSYRVCDSAYYDSSTGSVPLFPQPEDGDDALWNYAKTIPLMNYLKQRPVRMARCLPDMEQNPYLGVTGEASQQPNVQLYFKDVLGNAAAVSPGLNLTLPYRYTDRLAAPGTFPFTRLYYSTAGGRLVLAADSDIAMVPGISDKMRSAADQYAAAYFQYLQEDVRVAVSSSIVEGEQAIPAIDVSDYAAAGYLLCNAYESLHATPVTVPEGATLSMLAGTYAVEIGEIAGENGNLELNKLFSGSPAIPEFVSFPDSYTLVTLFSLPTEEIETIMAHPYNQRQPLNPGIYVNIPEQCADISESMSFASFAAEYGCSLDDAATCNELATGIFLQGAVFAYEGFAVCVEEPDEICLKDVVLTFNYDHGISVSPVELVSVNGDELVLSDKARLRYTTRQVAEGDTLASISGELETQAVVGLNCATAKLYAAGTCLLRGETVIGADSSMWEERVEEIAPLFGITAAALLEYNREVPLVPGVPLANRTFATITDEDAAVPYRLRRESLVDLSNKLGHGIPALAELNADMPVIAGSGQDITIGGVTVRLDDRRYSLNQVVNLFGDATTLAELLDAIKDRTDLLEAGRLFLSPPVILPGDGSAQTLCERFGVTPEALANVNLALPVLLEGAVLQLGQDVVVTTAADNLATVARRFSTPDRTVTPAEVLASNAGIPLFRQGGKALLPAGGLSYNFALKDECLLEGIFKLETSLEVARDKELVHEQLSGADGVARARTAVPALQERNQSGEYSVNGFVANLETAYPHVKVALGGGKSDLWCFVAGQAGGGHGLEALQISKGASYTRNGKATSLPRFFCLRPLSTNLESRENVEIRPLSEEGRLLPDAVPAAFAGIDLEQWGRAFLADIETLLGPGYTVPVYQAGLRQQLDRLIGCKETLAAAIVKGVGLVLRVDNHATEDAWDSVRKMLRDELRRDLNAAYTSDIIAQYDVEAKSQWEGLLAPMLSGLPDLGGGSGNDAQKGSGDRRTTDISAHKLSLQNGRSYTNMVLKTNAPEMQRTIPLNTLTYTVDQLEHQRGVLEQDYEKSAWLRFINQFREVNGGALDFTSEVPAPVPLRVFPNAPVFRGHSAAKHSEDISEGYLWDYTFRYQYDGYSQDTLYIKVTLNNDVAKTALRSETDRDLLDTMAQYISVRESLLAYLKDFPDGVDSGRARAALDSYIELAGDIAEAWSGHFSLERYASRKARGLEQVEVQYAITLDIVQGEDRTYYKGLILTRELDNPFAPPEMAAISIDGTRYPMHQAGAKDRSVVYEFEAGKEPGVSSFLDFELVLPGLNLLKYQNAASALQVLRNDKLLWDYGIALQEGFLYKTPIVESQTPITPLLAYESLFDLGAWTDDARTNPLQQVVQTLLAPAEHMTFTCQLTAGCLLAGDTYFQTPVALRMSEVYTGNFVRQVIGVMNAWKQEKGLARDNRRYTVSLTMYSDLEEKLPILTIRYAMSENMTV